MKKKILVMMTVMTAFMGEPALAMQPITLLEQGSFMAGGQTITAAGTYKDEEPLDFQGETLHGDAAYVFYQKPAGAKKNALVFLHGYGQSGKTWETTPDGRDGFQNIFLEKGWKTYIVDQPRRGRASKSTVPADLKAIPQDQLWYDTFRIGQYPDYYENAAVPRDEASRVRFFQQMVPDTGVLDNRLIADAMCAVMKQAGSSVLVTHSAGGAPGWIVAMENENVKGVIALEPGTFPFPEGEVPAVQRTTSPFPAIGMEVSMAEFRKLLKKPIVVYFGDNIITGDKPDTHWGLDNWRVRLNLANAWVRVVKKYGGEAEVIVLPERGIRGNTHFMMSDLNNKEVADELARWLHEKGLAQ